MVKQNVSLEDMRVDDSNDTFNIYERIMQHPEIKSMQGIEMFNISYDWSTFSIVFRMKHGEWMCGARWGLNFLENGAVDYRGFINHP